jgi:hypothetical protein
MENFERIAKRLGKLGQLSLVKCPFMTNCTFSLIFFYREWKIHKMKKIGFIIILRINAKWCKLIINCDVMT